MRQDFLLGLRWKGQPEPAKFPLGTSTTYLYERLNLVSEAVSTPANYLFGPGIDESVAMARDGQVYFYAIDALGSVTAVTDSSGTVQNSYLYDDWGQTSRQTDSLIVCSAISGIGSGRNSNTFVNGITTRCGIYVETSTQGDSPGWYQPRPTLP